MGAGIIEFISNIVNITGNPIADTIIFAIIGSISASIAFGFVEALFDFTGKYNSKDMSDVHWGVRVFIFALLTFILVKIAQFFRWLFTPPQLYFLIGFIVLAILLVVSLLVYKNRKNLTEGEKTTEFTATHQLENDFKIPTNANNQNRENEDNCPYCGGKLVQRKGPYGKFLGCANFPDCKYTRNQD